MKAPYPYYGGKSIIAPVVWQRLGDTTNYVEPFLGSAAVLLARPEHHVRKIETVNDKDGLIANFWRAVQADAEAVAEYADWPVNENDLHARHYWLVQQKESLTARLEGDPDFYDAKIAGWWCWGMCAWIGSGFCSGQGPWQVVEGQLVHVGDAGQGVNRKRVHVGDAGQGVNRKLVHVGNAGQGVNRKRDDLYEYFAALQDRLRFVRVCSGDWTRVMGESVTLKHGLTGVFLDPPYVQDTRDKGLYNHDSASIAIQVREWALANGDNPLFHIAYCGYEDGFTWPDGWTLYQWSGPSGFDGQRKNGKNGNRHREFVAFSPHCLKTPLHVAPRRRFDDVQMTLPLLPETE